MKGIYERIDETVRELANCVDGRYELQRTKFFPFHREPICRTHSQLQAKALCELIPECRIFDRHTGRVWFAEELGWIPSDEIAAGGHSYIPRLQEMGRNIATDRRPGDLPDSIDALDLTTKPVLEAYP